MIKKRPAEHTYCLKIPGGLVPVNVAAINPPGAARPLRTYGNKQYDRWLRLTKRDALKPSMRPIAAEETHADINTFKKNMAVAAAFANHLIANLLRTATFRAAKTGVSGGETARLAS